jgi:hypothetical protein
MSQEIKHLFRKKPELDLVNDILKALKFSGVNDGRLFHKNDINISAFDEFLPLLEPYYLPCKAKLFLRDFNKNKAITVLRHILRAHGYKLRAYEKLVQNKKLTLYQMERQHYEDLSGSLVVSFH